MSQVEEHEDSRTASVGKKRSRPQDELQDEPGSARSSMSPTVKRAKFDPSADFVSLLEEPENLDPGVYSGFATSNGRSEAILKEQSRTINALSSEEDADLQIHLAEEEQIKPGREPESALRDAARSTAVEVQHLDWEVSVEPTPSLAKATAATTHSHSLPDLPGHKGIGIGNEGPPRILSSISENERHYQQRYWGSVEDYALVRCHVCSCDGHMEDLCPARTCKHCGVRDDHFSIACPRVLKCKKCREPGHSVQTCPSKLARSTADGFSCDLCKQGGHVEENCSLIWRSFDPDKLFDMKKIDAMLVSCYECGSDRHWGGDCLLRPRNKQVNCDIFSAKYANRYLSQPIEPQRLHAGFSIRGRAENRVKKFPSDDEDDDPSLFYRKKPNTALPPRPPQRGKINIKADSFAHRNGAGMESQESDRGGGATGNRPEFSDGADQNRRNFQRYRERAKDRGNWRPPLPKEPLPQRPFAPYSVQKKRKRPPPMPVLAGDSFRPRR